MEEMTVATKTEEQTPIEIAMQIDERGMTTASALYNWLELDISNYARWCKSNIVDNAFAIEGEDYTVIKPSNGAFVTDDERENTGFVGNPKPKTDYHLTANFAKKLAMLTKSKKGEAARKYFITVENQVTDIAKQYNELLDCYKQAITMIKEVKEKQDTFAIEQKEISIAVNKLESGRSISGGHQSDWATKWHSRVRQLANAMNITVSSAYDRIFNLMGDMHSFIWADVKASYVSRHPEEGKDPWRIDVIDEAKGDLALWFIDAFNELAEPYGLEDYEEAYYEIGCFNPKELSDNIYYHKQSDEEIDEIIKGYYEFCQENGELAYGGN